MTSGLMKAYEDKTVLAGIDLNVRSGTAFSLLGPNGAGKTTTANILTTLLKADGGTVRVAGHNVATEAKAVRAAIGVARSVHGGGRVADGAASNRRQVWTRAAVARCGRSSASWWPMAWMTTAATTHDDKGGRTN